MSQFDVSWASIDNPEIVDGSLVVPPIGDEAIWHLRGNAYFPLEDQACSGLFREFGEMEYTPIGVEEFAWKYGHLGLTPPWEEENSMTSQREPLWRWYLESYAMKGLVDLWDEIQEGDSEVLEQRFDSIHDMMQIKVLDENLPLVKMLDKEVPLDVLSSEAEVELQNNPKYWEKETFTDPRETLGLNGMLIRMNPKRTCTLALNRRLNRFLDWKMKIVLGKDQKQTLVGDPQSLLNMMWYQFARSMERGAQFRKCDHCGIWFELTTTRGRSERAYCSNSCRQKAYRARKEAENA